MNGTDTKKADDEFLKIARERFQLAVDAELEIRRDALDDLKFRSGEQWPQDVKQSREIDRRPCLTINRLPQYLRQVTNDQRQNRPSIKVNPVDDNADVETAKVLQGLIRHIEYNSNADVAYDTAFEAAATKGLGYFRVITDFCDPQSFDQEILIKRIRNSFTVYLDPNYQEPDGSDSNWGFVFEDMSHDDYKAQYPESKLSGMTDWESIGDHAPGWASKASCRVAEYFYKTFKEVTLLQMNSKEVINKDDLADYMARPDIQAAIQVNPDAIQIVAERKSTLPAIKWCKMNGVEKLEETDWLGQWIPIIPVLGDELDIDGKRVLEGIIRHAKDPQRMYNYWASAETETIALAPRAPFIGAAGQFEGFEAQWKTANIKNHAYLEYNSKDASGTPQGPPARNVYEAPVQAITGARMQSKDDLNATTGIYDASLGNRSNEISGTAIQRRTTQAERTNFHYIDNLSRAMRHGGRIIVDLIPKVYDTPRTIRIIGESGEAEMVAINQIFQKNGKDVIHNLGVGKYDANVSSGPSYATKREEAVASMMELTKAYPQIVQVAGDLMVRNMDWSGAQEIADRLKKMLPPGLAEPDDKDQQPLPPQAQQAMQHMQQMIDQLTQHLNEKTHMIETKSVELASKERIAFAQIQAEIEVAMAKMGSQEAQTMLKEEVGAIQHRLDLLSMNQPIDQSSDAGGGQPPAAQPPQQQPTGGPTPGTPMGS